ncbi:hypothetical protein LMG28688_05408 [Paraburkholderia caffeinitolerans]|uniref:Uncharacterized protein n=2 Tax=Paraburkholderia caffeinitolerans TaxID=1723730 RepID=A0A6J5GM86_9BURK|nr:hypothetical protein LMG28688_05408 [Paraburkholderia caffeinitolerans]
MLSHHELAALLLIRDANAPLQRFDSDFLALERYHLVEINESGDGCAPRLTMRGKELLQRLMQGSGHYFDFDAR